LAELPAGTSVLDTYTIIGATGRKCSCSARAASKRINASLSATNSELAKAFSALMPTLRSRQGACSSRSDDTPPRTLVQSPARPLRDDRRAAARDAGRGVDHPAPAEGRDPRPASVRQPTGARRVGVAFESGEENRCESAMPKEDAYMAYIARPKGQPNVCSMPLGANLKPTALGTVFYDVVCPEACLWSPARQAASPSRTVDGQQERAPARLRRRRPPPEAD